MQNKLQAVLGLLVVAVLVVIGIFAYRMGPPATTSVSNADDTAVRAFVVAFGSKFKNVSILADDKSAQLATEYGPYVSSELLQRWQSNAESAPGRQTSSPWPERIDVVSVTPAGADIYTVEGNIIEMANTATPPEPAAVQPVSLTVKKNGDSFVITSFAKGAYSQLPQRISVVGYWECLPHKDTSGPQTTECAFGIVIDQSDGHYAIDTRLMSTYPVDFPTGTKVRVEGVLTPVEQLSSIQKYDIDGVLSATSITKI